MGSSGAGPSALFSILTVILIVVCSDKEIESRQKAIGVTSDEIVTGSSSAPSGHASFSGTQYTNGALAWFRELNSRGGIHGSSVRVLARDDAA